eukprot:COSAG05_NODE_21286_length_273_cov_0.580460_1_plen_73_part_01
MCSVVSLICLAVIATVCFSVIALCFSLLFTLGFFAHERRMGAFHGHEPHAAGLLPPTPTVATIAAASGGDGDN